MIKDQRLSSDWREVYPEGARLSAIVPVYNERYLVGEMLRRLLAVSREELEGVAELEVIVVDDGSTDGSIDVVKEVVAANPGRVRFLLQDTNRGKGAALRAGIEAANGDLIVFQDADLEYDPRDFARMLKPFAEDGADVVYGSRFLSGERRRVLFFRHSLGNRLITFVSNLFTDLNLTDVETCYKMFRAPLLKSLPLRSDRFGVEIEVTAKAAKRGFIIYEVPISYHGRTYQEGKKIGWRDGVQALLTAVRYWVIDDLYKSDPYGAAILRNLERAWRFNDWMADSVRPFVGSRVLEIGAGIGNISSRLIPRDLYVASEVNPDYLHYLRNLSAGKPYFEVSRIDAADEAAFGAHQQRYDTAVCINTLEHLPDSGETLRNVRGTLQPGGRLVAYVPAGQWLYSSLDKALEHRRRYDRASLAQELETAGFEVELLKPFNRAGLLGWLLNGKVLRRTGFGRVQLKIFDLLVPVLRRIDGLLPWPGLGLLAVARRPEAPTTSLPSASRRL